MAALSAVTALPLRLTSQRLGRAYRGLSAAVGVTTILIGSSIVVRLGA